MIKTLIAFALICGPAMAMPPNPALFETEEGQDGIAKMSVIIEEPQLWQEGIDDPNPDAVDMGLWLNPPVREGMAPAELRPYKVLVLCVDFDDAPATWPAAQLDTVVFGDKPGTVMEYYRTTSNGKLTIATDNLPSSLGWLRMPKPLTYYTAGNYAMGASPNNSQELTRHALRIADSLGVSFDPYDNNGDGKIECVWICWAGVGAESGGGSDAVWSHAWAFTPIPLDNVTASGFMIFPERRNSVNYTYIGVICHEAGHNMLGLSDLYASNGIGTWCLMSFGSWNNGGRTPAPLSAWCAAKVGFVDVEVISGAPRRFELKPRSNGGGVVRFDPSGSPYVYSYWFENRKKSGYDAYIKGEGLLGWCVDESQSRTNEYCWGVTIYEGKRPKVRMIQADGRCDMENGVNQGDAGDPFPGTSSVTRLTDQPAEPSTLWYGWTPKRTYLTLDSIQMLTFSGGNVRFKGGACDCPSQGDMDSSGTVTMADFARVVDVAFLGGVSPDDPSCPNERSDVNCDGVTNIRDVSAMRGIVRIPPSMKVCQPCK